VYLLKHGHPPVRGPGYDHGWPLIGVYGMWIAVVVALYPLCRWFAAKKSASRSVIMSYL
jgi:hypothetical protein